MECNVSEQFLNGTSAHIQCHKWWIAREQVRKSVTSLP